MNQTLALANALVGFGLPPVIAAINHTAWQAAVKAVVAFASCVAAAVLTTYAAGYLTSSNWLLSTLIVFGAAQASYRGIWKPTGLTAAIGNLTSNNGDGHTP